MSQTTVELRDGEKEITVHVEPSDRITGGVSVDFRCVTSPGSSWLQRIHLSSDEARKLLADLKEIL